ncbi:SDR family NAD(P)-dependent oxidoreductase [Lysinibacillus sp. G4S2]|uniref:SDR family NAD(P)-dependent oxidoreductase n=1 Tax=Lysinibacillus sp. G4S2 TaxID=3055859 RepID=UPI0025A0C682|nr:SDR family NAD(P)-dependent oxidoreductase [Lysinibacillus sp. G4S2]MDM5246501.1 SDR family NAD(P)-dependent oxidoreductase [Lysinibacillus sp. G4S2]
MRLFIITGVSSGLGEQIADKLIIKKEKLVAIGRKFTKKQLDVSQLSPDLIHLLYCDLSNEKEMNVLFDKFPSNYFNDVNEIVFINNAGVIGPINKIGKYGDSNFIKKHINVNYLSPLILINQLVRITPITKKIKIINISSGAATKAMEGWSLYCSSKAAIKMFLSVLEKESENIEVLNIDPGVMDTKMQQLIRNSDINEFPLLDQFQKYKDDGRLKDVTTVADEILKRIIQ